MLNESEQTRVPKPMSGFVGQTIQNLVLFHKGAFSASGITCFQAVKV